MKLIRNTILLIFSFSLLSFTNVLFEEEIEYEIIAKGGIYEDTFKGDSKYFTIDNLSEFEEFWPYVMGKDGPNRPYMDFSKSRLIVYGGLGIVDKITFSDKFINLYTSRIVDQPRVITIWGPPKVYFFLIKIPYNTKPVKWFEC